MRTPKLVEVSSCKYIDRKSLKHWWIQICGRRVLDWVELKLPPDVPNVTSHRKKLDSQLREAARVECDWWDLHHPGFQICLVPSMWEIACMKWFNIWEKGKKQTNKLLKTLQGWWNFVIFKYLSKNVFCFFCLFFFNRATLYQEKMSTSHASKVRYKNSRPEVDTLSNSSEMSHSVIQKLQDDSSTSITDDWKERRTKPVSSLVHGL